ncbi:hypothetical protein PM082_009456 [Marasmius tenuissimus]|nr:hypothetical protein PM082_009456 [Marasmius tenuissimus]
MPVEIPMWLLGLRDKRNNIDDFFSLAKCAVEYIVPYEDDVVSSAATFPTNNPEGRLSVMRSPEFATMVADDDADEENCPPSQKEMFEMGWVCNRSQDSKFTTTYSKLFDPDLQPFHFCLGHYYCM